MSVGNGQKSAAVCEVKTLSLPAWHCTQTTQLSGMYMIDVKWQPRSWRKGGALRPRAGFDATAYGGVAGPDTGQNAPLNAMKHHTSNGSVKLKVKLPARTATGLRSRKFMICTSVIAC